MKNNNTISYQNNNNKSALIGHQSRSALSKTLTAFMAAAIVLDASVQAAHTQTLNIGGSHVLNPGDIVYADSGNAVDGGFVVKVDPTTGLETVISSGGYLQMPFAPLVDANGKIVVSDSGRLIRIDPDSGMQNILVDNSQGSLGLPYGISLNGSGQILAANLQSIVQVDPLTQQIRTVSTGGSFRYPLGVTMAANGELFVLNMAFPAQIVRVNPQNGGQKVVSQGGFLNHPQGITLSGADIFVTDVATPDGNFGVGRVIHIDAHTGNQTIVSEGNSLVGPVGIAVDENGQVIVGDPYTVNPQSPDLADGGYDGAIIRIDPATGLQTVLARGQAGFVNPRGVAIVPGTVTSR
jgi:hypothetical protein